MLLVVVGNTLVGQHIQYQTKPPNVDVRKLRKYEPFLRTLHCLSYKKEESICSDCIDLSSPLLLFDHWQCR